MWSPMGSLSRLERIAIVDRVCTEEMAKPYEPGASDCFILGVAIIDAMRGTSYRSDLSGAYQTIAGSQRALRRRGHTSLITFFPSLGLDRIPAGKCSPGDVVVTVVDRVEHVAVFTGSVFRSRSPDGPMNFRMGDVAAAFKV